MKATVDYHGSLFLVRPEDPEARAWLQEAVGPEASWWGPASEPALVVEANYLDDLLQGFEAAGGDAGDSSGGPGI